MGEKNSWVIKFGFKEGGKLQMHSHLLLYFCCPRHFGDLGPLRHAIQNVMTMVTLTLINWSLTF